MRRSVSLSLRGGSCFAPRGLMAGNISHQVLRLEGSSVEAGALAFASILESMWTVAGWSELPDWERCAARARASFFSSENRA